MSAASESRRWRALSTGASTTRSALAHVVTNHNGTPRGHRNRKPHHLMRWAFASAIAATLLCPTSPIPALAEDKPAAAEDKPAAAEDKPATPEDKPSSALPAIVVTDAAKKQRRAAAKRQVAPHAVASGTTAQTGQTAQEAPVSGTGGPTPAQAALDRKMQNFDQQRDHILTKLGATTDTINRTNIIDSPQGDNKSIDKLVLEFPGVNYDSAVSNPNFHVRGEYNNVATRIDGFVLPEGVSSLGPVVDTNFIGSISLLTGTLPAQYGLRTAGVLDITSRTFSTPGGDVEIYGGSFGTVTPSFDYGGSVGNTQYFFSGRGNFNDLGIENPTSSLNAIHDHTDQGKFFAYVSTAINDTQRLSIISGAAYSFFQIPNNPDQPVFPDNSGNNLPNGLGMTTLSNLANTANSSTLNEREIDQYYYNIVALQSHGDLIDSQISVFSRYANVHFIPDVTNDLIFNGVASDVTRASQMYGTQFDASYEVNDRHTLRAGFMITAEKTDISNISTVFDVDPTTGNPTGAPFTIVDTNSLLGWNLGAYVQDEWKLTQTLTLNYGIRFDQLYQYVDANQFSPRVALVYKPFDGTTFHAGYARYFTPPMQAQAATSNVALFNNTTNQPDQPNANPVLPERSHYFDVGVDQKVLPGLTFGLDAYYKIATDLIDDGQFGQAVVLTQFNYAYGWAEGIEAKAKYQNGNWYAYINFAFNITRATDPISNQYLLDGPTYQFLLTNYHYTDDSQMFTGSAGVAYKWDQTTFSTSLKYGSGLPDGFANSSHDEPYVTVNLGVARDFMVAPGAKPTTVRFDVVNLFDKIYEIRDGSGIGVFAPQFGERRGFFLGLSQKL
jgi:outer membrane receptor protein involved in Fe transport